jgi:hypothetical protein
LLKDQSFLGTAKLLLGDAVKEGTQLSINPLVLWAWAGLLAMWGRKVVAIKSISSLLVGLYLRRAYILAHHWRF